MLGRRNFLKMVGASVMGLSAQLSAAATAGKVKNVLWIGIDDLRPQIEGYDFGMMKTPNFERLAELGVQFDRAYVQQAVCAASRASLTTGCRPDTTGVNYPYSDWFDWNFKKKHRTVVEHFYLNGFYTRTLGKIHHGPSDKYVSEGHYSAEAGYYALTENQHGDPKAKHTEINKPWEHADLPDNKYGDGQVCDEAIQTIRRAVKSGKRFFIAPGFKKPHLPFVCPKKYYDMYNRKDIKLAAHPERGPSQPDFTTSDATGASKWWKFKKEGIDDNYAKQLRHSYYACVSFIDAQLGKILDELIRLKLMDSTMIMLWSDHGWHLGDHGMWGKSTNYEWSARSPLYCYVPGMKGSSVRSKALVEYVDMYPTLTDCAGIPTPSWIEGTSFKALLDEPHRKWKNAAFSQFPRGDKEGYSVRTKDYRYTQWRKSKTNDIVFEELYDDRKDLLETKNIAKDSDYKKVLNYHRKVLKEGWKNSLPSGYKNSANNPRGKDDYYKLDKTKQKARYNKLRAEYENTAEGRKENAVYNEALKRAGSTGETASAKIKSAETSETKEWLRNHFKAKSASDLNKDGVLTRSEWYEFIQKPDPKLGK